DVQRRRFGHHRGRDRARGLPLARRAGAGAGQGGESRRAAVTAATVTFCVVAAQTDRLDRFLADQLAMSRTVAARPLADKSVRAGRGTPLAPGAEGRPGIVHRLDRDTSGLLLVAKTEAAHRRLATMIEQRRVERLYAALAWGHFAKSPVTIEAPITRHPKDRKRMTVLAGGRHAVTHAAVVARFAQVDLLRVRLGTGRTPQVRVHLAHVGHPVVG